jgi:hypothetical protein
MPLKNGISTMIFLSDSDHYLPDIIAFLILIVLPLSSGVELAKGAKRIAVQVLMDGRVMFFADLK